MAYISQIQDTSGTTHQIRPYTASLSSINLNTITGTGFYEVNNCSNSKYTNATLVCTKKGNGCTQIETDYSTGMIATRTYNGTTWSDWLELSSILAITDDDGVVMFSPITAYQNRDNNGY